MCVAAAAAAIAPSLSACSASGGPALPSTRFFVFGEGDRRKLLYRDGKLSDLKTGEIVWYGAVTHETIRASETAVEVIADGQLSRIREDESGVWIGDTRIVSGSQIQRPRFAESPHAGRLRALHHELLVNICDGAPVPNLFVYDRPWRRDAAMMAMCLAKTGNLHLIKNWVASLDSVFDVNAGVEEPDNIGQTLYLLSLAGASGKHPLAVRCLDDVRRFQSGDHIAGSTDGARHAAYQTLWLKTGLKALGLADPYRVPWQLDHYRSLVWWMAQPGMPYPLRFGRATGQNYPYLSWAEAHYWNVEHPALPDPDSFPQTWEANAAADYSKMRTIGREWAAARIAGPHGWHAAEAFLYLLRQA